MKKVKKRIWSGRVLEQIIYPVSDKAKNLKSAKPRLRFKTEEDRVKHREGIARRRYAKLINANFSETSLYSTLTFDNAHEAHSFEDARAMRNAFIRRVKYRCPDAVVTIVMGRGDNTHRIHLHMISEGITVFDIMECWTFGRVERCEHMRAECFYKENGIRKSFGRDYTALANYLFDHWSVEQGGHHYYFSRNRMEPEEEEPKEVKRRYTIANPPRAPMGYRMTEAFQTDYGYIYFKFVFDPKKSE